MTPFTLVQIGNSVKWASPDRKSALTWVARYFVEDPEGPVSWFGFSLIEGDLDEGDVTTTSFEGITDWDLDENDEVTNVEVRVRPTAADPWDTPWELAA